MTNPAEEFYSSLVTVGDIQRLISEGEVENQYLECKSPQAPILDRGLRQELAEAISGFANSGGGTILWGVSTTPHSHSKIDVLTQIEEIGAVRNFKKQIDLATITLMDPQTVSCQSKLILKNPSDTKGIIVTLVPPTSGDPVRSTTDREFYIRVGANFNKMPYETIKRMFAGSAGPDLAVLFDKRLVKKQSDGSWKIPIILKNHSSAAARDTEVSVTVSDETACESISSEGFIDQSEINPGKKIFMANVGRPIFRGRNSLVGSLIVIMKKQKFPRRKLELAVDIFATNMRAKQYIITVQLAKIGFAVKKIEEKYLY